MRFLNLFIFAFLFAVVIFSYYYFGGSSFADYKTYYHLAYTKLDGVYFSEFISWFLLKTDLFEYGQWNRVDTFAFFCQFFVFLSMPLIILNSNKASGYATVVFCCLYLPLLLTTTLRASIVHVAFLYYCLYVKYKQKNKIQYIIFFTLIGLMFHDSTILVTLVLLVSLLFNHLFRYNKNVILIIIFSSSLLIIFSHVVKEIILSNIVGIDLGARSAYLNADLYSISKQIFCLVVVLLSSIYCLENESKFSLELAFLVAALAFVFAINSVAAIRFSIFVITYLVVFKGGILFSFESKKLNMFFIYPFWLSIFSFQLYILL